MQIQKRLTELREEVNFEKGKRERIEFMTGVMAGHQHRISLYITKGRLKGKTERVQGHVHKVDIGLVEKDLLGFTEPEDNHKHRVSFKLKDVVSTEKKKKGKDKDKC